MFGTYRKILGLLRPAERRRFWLIGALVIISGLIEVASLGAILPFLTLLSDPTLMDPGGRLHRLYAWGGFDSHLQFQVAVGAFTFVALMGGLVVKTGTFYLVTRFATLCGYSISSRLLQGYLHKPYAWYLDRNTTDLGKTILEEVGRIVQSVLRPAMNLMSHLALVVVLVGILIAVEPFAATFIAALMVAAYLAIYWILRGFLLRAGTEIVTTNRARFRIASESTGAIRDVKLLGLEESYVRRFNVPSRQLALRAAQTQVLAYVPRFLLEGIAFGGVIVLLIVMLLRETGGLMEILPTVGFFAVAGLRLLPALQQVYMMASSLRSGAPLLDQVHAEMLDASADSETWVRKRPDGRLGLAREVAFDGVTFTYTGSAAPVLDALDLAIAARTTVAFVGSTGAGKTTAADILLGILAPQSGTLRVDGRPVGRREMPMWQDMLGYVPQQIYLCDDTVRNNIAFGVPEDEIDDDAVERAARVAEIHNFILNELPEGYATAVGERGVRLSGGQRQRIGIARALYRDPEVLIMDEATSALDNLTERAVMDAIRNLGGKKTIVLIAHRLSTVEHCDRIFLFRDGRVVAAGTYLELLENSPEFRAMTLTEPAGA